MSETAPDSGSVPLPVAVTRQPGSAGIMLQQLCQDSPVHDSDVNFSGTLLELDLKKPLNSNFMADTGGLSSPSGDWRSIGDSKSDNDVYETIKSFLLIDAEEKVQVN